MKDHTDDGTRDANRNPQDQNRDARNESRDARDENWNGREETPDTDTARGIPFDALSREARPPRDIWPELRARIEAGSAARRDEPRDRVRRGEPADRVRHGPVGAGMLRIAATLLIFAGGAAVGWMARGGSDRPVAEQGPVPASLAERVQSTGSEYVASLAMLVEQRNELGAAEVEAGHEVAMATLSGAAYELARLRPEEPEHDLLYDALEAHWLQASEESAELR